MRIKERYKRSEPATDTSTT